jgi:hypothetical protein
VLRYETDRHIYQYEKELEDFIHSRQVASENGEAAELAENGAAKAPRPRRRRSQAPPRSRS